MLPSRRPGRRPRGTEQRSEHLPIAPFHTASVSVDGTWSYTDSHAPSDQRRPVPGASDSRPPTEPRPISLTTTEGNRDGEGAARPGNARGDAAHAVQTPRPRTHLRRSWAESKGCLMTHRQEGPGGPTREPLRAAESERGMTLGNDQAFQ